MNFKNLINERKSTRDFSSKLVSEGNLNLLLDYAKSCEDLVESISTDIYIMDNELVYEKLDGIAGYKKIMISAPHYIVILSENKEHAIENAGYLGENIVLKAVEMGIDSCWITIPESKIVKDALGIKDEKELFALIGIGYEDESKRISNAPKIGTNYSKAKLDIDDSYVSSRLGVEEIVYLDKWGNNANYSYIENSGLLEPFYYARLAPSPLNSQPWRYIIDGGNLVLCIKNDEKSNSYDSAITTGIEMLYFELIFEQMLTGMKWVLESPEKDYEIGDDYSIVGYCKI